MAGRVGETLSAGAHEAPVAGSLGARCCCSGVIERSSVFGATGASQLCGAPYDDRVKIGAVGTTIS